MTTQTYGSVIVLAFQKRPVLNFVAIVNEFDFAFQMMESRARSLSWDCEDIAIIDRDRVRLALGWQPAPEDGQTSYLIIAVGAGPGLTNSEKDLASFEYLADKICEKTRYLLPYSSVLHGQAEQPICAELIDTISDLLKLEEQARAGSQIAAE